MGRYESKRPVLNNGTQMVEFKCFKPYYSQLSTLDDLTLSLESLGSETRQEFRGTLRNHRKSSRLSLRANLRF